MQTNDEPETVMDACPSCQAFTAHTVDAEPCLMTVQVMDCVGEYEPARVGVPVVRCCACGTTSPWTLALNQIANAAALENVRRSFCRWMQRMEDGRRKDVLAAIYGTGCIGIGAVTAFTASTWWSAVIGTACVCVGAALVWIAMGRRYVSVEKREVCDGE